MKFSIAQHCGKNWRLKPEHAACFVAVCLLMGTAQDAVATRLGDIVSVSPIGQPLRVEISSPGSHGDEVAACIRAPSPPSPDGIPSVGGARVSVTGRDQNARIVITHPDPAGEPILRLTLENICSSRLRREYVLLLPEPLELAYELNVPSTARVAPASSVQRPAAPRAQARVPEAEPVGQPVRARTTRPATTPATPAPVDRLMLEQATAEMGVADRDGLSPEAQEIAREERLVAAIDRTIDAQLELLERIRRLEEIQLALRAQLEAEETIPAAAPTAPAGPDASDAVPERGGEGIPERAAPASAEGENSWLGGAILFGVSALLLALLLRREGSNATASARAARNRRDTGKSNASVHGAWPDGAPTGTDERSTPGDNERSGQVGEKAIPAAVKWEELDQPTEPAVSEVVTLAPLTLNDDAVEEHESAIELADIMVSFGRLQGAAETLADFIRSNPKQALTPWLKLMDVYRIADMKPEFDALARQLNKTFNVKTVTWMNFDEARQHGGSVEAMPHILERITKTWRTQECQAYLETIVRDNREGTRQGFGLGVIDDILMLSAVLEEHLGRYKPPEQ